MEHKSMLSVGIDIGTSTSQVIFSRLSMENMAGYFSIPSISIVKKDVVYRSPVYSTPLLDPSHINGKAMRKIIEAEYGACGVAPNQVETGAVIITGEAARKENAAVVLEQMSGLAGDFVVSTAGPDLESVIAGQGSGAQRFSEENSAVVVNLDIGGGTTNIVLFDCGEVKARGCLDIGGRQVTLDAEGRITYISPSARRIAEVNQLPLRTGETVRRELLDALCYRMNELLEQLLGVTESCRLLEEIQTAGSSGFVIPADVRIRYICFSGGVADCIYKPGKEPFAYGDIGVLLGEAIRRGRLFQSFQVMEAAETIRATVIGAGSYTTTISGSTISYAAGMFPLKNVPVLRLSEEEEAACWKGDVSLLLGKVRWFLSQNDAERMALAIEGYADPDYSELKRLAETLTAAMDQVLADNAPLLLIVQQDIAKALGQLMTRLLGKHRPVIAIDGIHADQNNFIDLGNPIMNGLVVPVVVKTLIFG